MKNISQHRNGAAPGDEEVTSQARSKLRAPKSDEEAPLRASRMDEIRFRTPISRFWRPLLGELSEVMKLMFESHFRRKRVFFNKAKVL
ncbi:homeobox protein Nkx-2.1 isoform X3 [Brienomyrus brachyistius]|uniref:homeobox protein Nkx-2.1 isoform X3 n=1 Tax=Brienomyrus brachyistius TaxID=42636 RepID=UPI0020B2A518|nr:homeobox protein Nkx-2.1 isoform X3 [Brienomyrus brachyistius]